MLFCYEQFDELTLLHLREFDKKKLISVETDIVVDHYKEEKFEDSKPGVVLSHTPDHSSRTPLVVTPGILTFCLSSAAAERLTQEQADDLMAWMKNALGPRVTNIKVKIRLNVYISSYSYT